MSGPAYGACPISAGTTKAIRPPGRSLLAAATMNGAHDDESPLKTTPRRRQ